MSRSKPPATHETCRTFSLSPRAAGKASVKTKTILAGVRGKGALELQSLADSTIASPIANRKSKIKNHIDRKSKMKDSSPTARRKPRCCDDRRQLTGLFSQCIDFILCEQPAIDDQFHPVGGFIGFFLDCSQLSDKFGLGTSSTSRTIIGADRGSASGQLISQHTTFRRSGNSGHELENAQRKLFCSILQFNF